MTERRCEACEAVILELDCQECLAYAQSLVAQARSAELLAKPRPIRTHCVKGHEMTEANTRIDVYVGNGRQSVTRACRTCHNARTKRRKDKAKANG